MAPVSNDALGDYRDMPPVSNDAIGDCRDMAPESITGIQRFWLVYVLNKFVEVPVYKIVF